MQILPLLVKIFPETKSLINIFKNMYISTVPTFGNHRPSNKKKGGGGKKNFFKNKQSQMTTKAEISN